MERLLRKAFHVPDEEVEAALARIWGKLSPTIMDYTFSEAMAELEGFHGMSEIPVFEGQRLRGILACPIPEFCAKHKEPLDLSEARTSIYGPERLNAVFPCGCISMGRFREVVAA